MGHQGHHVDGAAVGAQGGHLVIHQVDDVGTRQGLDLVALAHGGFDGGLVGHIRQPGAGLLGSEVLDPVGEGLVLGVAGQGLLPEAHGLGPILGLHGQAGQAVVAHGGGGGQLHQ